MIDQGLWFSDAKDLVEIHITGDRCRCSVYNIGFFYQSILLPLRRDTTKNLYPSTTIVHVDDNALLE